MGPDVLAIPALLAAVDADLIAKIVVVAILALGGLLSGSRKKRSQGQSPREESEPDGQDRVEFPDEAGERDERADVPHPPPPRPRPPVVVRHPQPPARRPDLAPRGDARPHVLPPRRADPLPEGTPTPQETHPAYDYDQARSLAGARATSGPAAAPHTRPAVIAGRALLEQGDASLRNRARAAVGWSIVLGPPRCRQPVPPRGGLHGR